MLELIVENETLVNYTKEHGGILSIGNYYQIKGWWNAVKMPSGRMVKPEKMPSLKKISDYYQFIFKDIIVNIEKSLLNGKSEIEFLIITYGRYKIIKEDGLLRIV